MNAANRLKTRSRRHLSQAIRGCTPVALSLALSCAVSPLAFAAFDDFDGNYGSAGQASYSVPSGFALPSSSAVVATATDSQNRLYVVFRATDANAADPTSLYFYLVRFSAAGGIDGGFGQIALDPTTRSTDIDNDVSIAVDDSITGGRIYFLALPKPKPFRLITVKAFDFSGAPAIAFNGGSLTFSLVPNPVLSDDTVESDFGPAIEVNSSNGKLVITATDVQNGSQIQPGPYSAATAIVTPNGVLDTTFNSAGVIPGIKLETTPTSLQGAISIGAGVDAINNRVLNIGGGLNTAGTAFSATIFADDADGAATSGFNGGAPKVLDLGTAGQNSFFLFSRFGSGGLIQLLGIAGTINPLATPPFQGTVTGVQLSAAGVRDTSFDGSSSLTPGLISQAAHFGDGRYASIPPADSVNGTIYVCVTRGFGSVSSVGSPGAPCSTIKSGGTTTGGTTGGTTGTTTGGTTGSTTGGTTGSTTGSTTGGTTGSTTGSTTGGTTGTTTGGTTGGTTGSTTGGTTGSSSGHHGGGALDWLAISGLLFGAAARRRSTRT